MNAESYRFELGDCQCVSVTDGTADYPLTNFFANVPLEDIELALRQRDLPVDYVTTPFTYLHVDTGEHQVLVDTGAGSLAPGTGNLLHNLRAAGIDPLDVDTVVITHAHPDHIGGTLGQDGNLVYGRAHYYMWKGEWDFWFSELAEDKTPERFVTCARTNLEPLRDRMTLVGRKSEIVPGISVIPAPGHTPGHAVVSVSSGGERLLYIAHTVLHPLHLEHLDWTPIYDILPARAAETKRRIFDLAAEEKAWVMGQHFPPFPSLGHVVKSGEGWEWQPAKIEG